MAKEKAPKPGKRPDSLTEPYEPGVSWFTRSPLLQFDKEKEAEEDQIRSLYEKTRVSHPNVAASMKTTGGQMNKDIVAGLPVSRKDMLGYYRESHPYGSGEGDPGRGWGGLHEDDLDAASDKLRRDGEEIAVTVGSVKRDENGQLHLDTSSGKLAELDEAYVTDPPKPTGNFVKRFFTREIDPEWRRENIMRDKKYMSERALWLVGLDGAADPLVDFDPKEVVAKHEAVLTSFMNARRHDGSTNKEALQAIAWDQAHNDYDEHGNRLNTEEKAAEQNSDTPE